MCLSLSSRNRLRIARIRKIHAVFRGIVAPFLEPGPLRLPALFLDLTVRALPLLVPDSGRVRIAPSCMSFRISVRVMAELMASMSSGSSHILFLPTLSMSAAMRLRDLPLILVSLQLMLIPLLPSIRAL